MPDFNQFLLSNYGCSPWHQAVQRPKSAVDRPRSKSNKPQFIPIKRQQGQPFPLKISCIGEQLQKRRKSRIYPHNFRPKTRRTNSISQSEQYSKRVKKIKVISRQKSSLGSYVRGKEQSFYRTGLTYKSLRDKLKSLKINFDQLKLLQKNHHSIKVSRIFKANS